MGGGVNGSATFQFRLAIIVRQPGSRSLSLESRFRRQKVRTNISLSVAMLLARWTPSFESGFKGILVKESQSDCWENLPVGGSIVASSRPSKFSMLVWRLS